MQVDARIGLSDGAIDDLMRSSLDPADVAARALTSAEMAATGDISGRVPEGYVIPYFDLHGDIAPYYRVKILDPLGGPKYRALKGMPNHIYFPPKFRKLLEQPQHKYVIITEGEKKAACAVRHGFPCVGLSGVDNWKNRQISFPESTKFRAVKQQGIIQAKIPSGDANAMVLQDSGVVAVGFNDLVDYMVEREMEAIIVFDSDRGGVKSQVQRAAAQLGYELRYRGIPISGVRHLVLPSTKDEKVGLDDYLIKHGTKNFAGLLRAVRAKRMAFPKHPNPKVYVASRLQRARLSRKETQDVSLAVLMELETRGRRLLNKNTRDMFYFNNKSHTLSQVTLNNPRVPMHDTAFGGYLYREFNLSQVDQRVIGWLAAQFNGEPGVDEVITHRVLAKPSDMPDCVAYQLSDSHFVIITPRPDQPYIICENGQHGVLFEQGHVEPLNHKNIEIMIEEHLHDNSILWKQTVEGFEFTPTEPIGAGQLVDANRPSHDQLLEEGRMLAMLLYYMSPWLLRWRGTQLPVEMVIGEPGSGKSSLYALRQTILTGYPRLSNMTNDIKDWYAGITSHGGLHILDNVHFTGSNKDYQQRLSDELCRLVTEPDPHIELRKLYTTSDMVSLPVTTTFALTAIEQPFFTTDLIQRSAIFELQAISDGHDAAWIPKQIDRAGGRAGWVGHHIAVLHKFLRRTVHEGAWDDDYQAMHRLANYEQCLIWMAEVLGLPSDWIPAHLQRATATKMSDTDWTMAGLADFVSDLKSRYGEKYRAQRFSAKDIGSWANGHDTYCNNTTLTNGWKLGKYLRSHRGSLKKNLRMYENGTHANKTMYSVD